MPAATIDEYLAGVPDHKRAALQRLREQIHAVAPGGGSSAHDAEFGSRFSEEFAAHLE